MRFQGQDGYLPGTIGPGTRVGAGFVVLDLIADGRRSGWLLHRGALPAPGPRGLLVYANHPGFWDGFVAHQLCEARGWDGYCAMDEAQLQIEHFWAGALRRAVIDGDVAYFGDGHGVLHAVDAEYGFSSGGVLNLSMKSGTNEYHGTGYWFGRNPCRRRIVAGVEANA